MIITDNSPISSVHNAIVQACDSNLRHQQGIIVSSVRGLPGAVEINSGLPGFRPTVAERLSFDGQAVSGHVFVRYAGIADRQTPADSHPAVLNEQARIGMNFERTLANLIDDASGPTAAQIATPSSSGLTLHAAATPAVAPAATATDVHLVVNTASGLVTLISAVSGSQAIITAYTVKSPSGSLVKFKNSGSKYLGSAFQNNPGVFYSSSNGNTYNNWTGIKNTSTIIGEGFGNNYIATNDTTWTNYTLSSGGYALGAMFKTLSAGGVQDLSFQWDDKALNTFTSVVDYVPAPEPTAVSLVAMGAYGLLGRRRRSRVTTSN